MNLLIENKTKKTVNLVAIFSSVVREMKHPTCCNVVGGPTTINSG